MEQVRKPYQSRDQSGDFVYTDILNEEYGLYDLVPYDSIKALLEAHQRVIQVPIGLVSPNSDLLLSLGWQPVCSDFHRAHPESSQACLDSNRTIQVDLFEEGAAAKKCANGLWDIAMPIMVGGRHLATVFIGQFLYDDETPDSEFFREQARRFGYDEPSYMAAVEKVPRLPRAHVSSIIDYTADLIALLAELGLKNLQLTREIREKQMAEFALIEGERRYRALVENVPGAVYLCLNDDAFTTIFVSDAIEDIIGFSAQSMIDEAASLMNLIHPEDRGTITLLVNEAVAKEEKYVLNYRMLCKDGHYIRVEERGQAVVDESGALRFLQGVIFDVSEHLHFEEERRKIETQMARAHKLESLGLLAGGIAHDFNNLLVGILGHAELVREDVAKGSPAESSVEAIISAAHSAADLTRKMLAYSGKGHFNTEVVDLSTVVREAQSLLRTKSLDAYTFRYELQENLPTVFVDIGEVNQVLVSLVDNAAEAYPDGTGEVLVRTGTQTYDDAFSESAYLGQDIPEGEYVYLEVSDFGCGMSEETRRRLCDPFFTTKFTGRGLSMAAVLGIARGHHAHLTVDSEPGKGTRVRIFFPVYEAATPHAPRAEDASKPRFPKVLLVDDEAIVRNAARKMLQHAGFEVLIADSGPVAIDMIRKFNGDIECMILDLTMPEMNGEETLRAVRAIYPDLPVVLSSGYTRETALENLVSLNVAAFLQKPYDLKTLANILNAVLRRRP